MKDVNIPTEAARPMLAATRTSTVFRWYTPALLVAVAFVIWLALGSCSVSPTDNDEGRQMEKRPVAIRSEALTELRTISVRLRATLKSARLFISSCNDNRDGNSWRASAIGEYTNAPTVKAAPILLRTQQASLGAQGWKAGTTVTSGGASLSRNEGAEILELHRTFFTYDGTCYALSNDDLETIDEHMRAVEIRDWLK